MALRPVPESAASGPLTVWQGTVLPAWVDYNGHMNDACYMVAFSLATDALMGHVGLDAAGRAATGHSIFTLEAHINYLGEVAEGVAIEVRTQILGSDAKRMHIYNSMHRAGEPALLAANEQMLLNVDMRTRRSARFAPSVAPRVLALSTAHRDLPWPEYAGRRMGLPA